jgi:hypothetical protein
MKPPRYQGLILVSVFGTLREAQIRALRRGGVATRATPRGGLAVTFVHPIGVPRLPPGVRATYPRTCGRGSTRERGQRITP